MNSIHWKQEMKYLNAVARYLIDLGYDVEKPDSEHRDLLDVWGLYKGKKCFVEIYVTMWPCGNGINGVWDRDEHDGVEVYLDLNQRYGLDTREHLPRILGDLKPLYKRSAA